MPQPQPQSLGDWLVHGKVPYGDIWRGMGNVIPGLINAAQATPGTLRTLGQLQTGERQAPPGPARALQYVLQQADVTAKKGPRASFHASDFTGIPGSIANYYGSNYGTWGDLGRNLRDNPVRTAADLSVAAGAPEDVARGAASLAARAGAPRAVQTAIEAARGITRPAARVAAAINPAAPVVAAGTTALRRASGMFDATGAFTPRGLAQLQKAGNAAFPNGEITAAEYADPRFQAHMAPITRRSGFTPQAFKEGVISYSGAPTPSGPITGVRPGGAPATARTSDLIQSGHAAIDARVRSIGRVPADMPAPSANTIRAALNDPAAKFSGPVSTDLRLAAAGKDALDSPMVTPAPSILGAVGPKLAKGAWEAGTTLAGGLLGGAVAAPLALHAPTLAAAAKFAPDLLGAAGGYLFGHKTGAPGILGSSLKGAGDAVEAARADQGAPTNWLNVPSWTGAAIQRAAPAAISIGRNVDPGQPGPAAAPAAAPGLEAPPPGGWQAPVPHVPDTLEDDAAPTEAPPGQAAPEAPAPEAQHEAPAAHDTTLKGPEHDPIAPPELQKMMRPQYVPQPFDDAPAPDAAPQADGGRVGFAEGGQVADMTAALLKRAEAHQHAARAATKPMLSLSDDTVARALRVAQRGL
jgi:hypothetical protein